MCREAALVDAHPPEDQPVTRAERLAADLKTETLSGAARVLADEAVRITRRLERLDAQLEGDQDAWLHLTVNLPETVAEVQVDKALAEARQQALALKGVLAELRAIQGDAGKHEAPPAPSGGADDLAEARRKRLEQAAAQG